MTYGDKRISFTIGGNVKFWDYKKSEIQLHGKQ